MFNNVVTLLGNQAVTSEWVPADSNCLIDKRNINTEHLMRFKYDQHDVTVAFTSHSPSMEEFTVGQTFNFTGPSDKLKIKLEKTSGWRGQIKELDFSLKLDKGGKEMVFVYVEESHLTIKGHNFAGQNSSHILFESLLHPFLKRKVIDALSTDGKTEIKKEDKLLEIIDLTDEPEAVNMKRERIEEDTRREDMEVKKVKFEGPQENTDNIVINLVEEENEAVPLKKEGPDEATIEEVKDVKIEDITTTGVAGPLPSKTRLFLPSPQLALLLPTGFLPLTRPQVVKGLWAYLKQRGLQDPTDKNFFTPDVAMRAIFGTERMRGVSVSMSKYIKEHITPL